jgi:RNA polymerase sigma factor (sigma-70 family)
MTEPEFEALYLKHRADWLTLARKLTKNSAVAEDVLSEVMLIVAREGLPKFRIEENPEAWIRQRLVWYVKRFVWFNEETKDHIDQHTVSMTGYENVLPQQVELDHNAPTPLEAPLRRALETLDVVQQDVVCLRVFGKLTFTEIGRILALDENSAKAEESARWKYRKAIPRLQLALESVGISALTCGGSMLNAITQSESSR